MLIRFQDPSYVNWVKAGQALLCTAEGIHDFCEGPIRQYHQDLYKKFPWKHCKANCGYVFDNIMCACIYRICSIKYTLPNKGYKAAVFQVTDKS